MYFGGDLQTFPRNRCLNIHCTNTTMAERISQASGTSLPNAKHHFPATKKKSTLFLFMKCKGVGLLEHLILCLCTTDFKCLKILPLRHEIRYEIGGVREHPTINISKVCHNTCSLFSYTQEQATNRYPDQKKTLYRCRFRQHYFELNLGLFLLILPAQPIFFLPFCFLG